MIHRYSYACFSMLFLHNYVTRLLNIHCTVFHHQIELILPKTNTLHLIDEKFMES